MGVEIDLRRAVMHRKHGDIIAVYSYFDDERALFLMPAHRRGAPWFLVAESAAFKYAEPLYLQKQSLKACEVLGLQEIEWFKVARIIDEGLSDLIRMPSAPERERSRAAVGSMVIKVDGQTVAEHDVHPELEGATYG